MRQAVRELPLDRIVLETDCPFLSPEPYRGRRNEPAYTVFTAKALAEATGWPIETVWQASADNAIGFFKLDGDDQAAR
jgi:TatD DNase family protein